MLFTDRKHAGKLLANLLTKYKNDKNTIVIGLPRGGVVLAYEIAKELQLPIDIICARKIGAPYNPEFAIGAITETGESFLDLGTIERLGIPKKYLDVEIKKESEEAARRNVLYKKNFPPHDLEGKTVILVDDGIATGATMKATIKAVKNKKAKTVIVAIPVAAPDTLREIKKEVNEVICLAAPIFFQAVGQFYEDFPQTSDQEVIDLLNEDLK
ncbi:MAG: phosphoribosyltransferase [Parachlamydiaceae bacterium]|nr:phosphoribosyltransferase [Parachlamydiaceae bacterium]